MKLQRMNIWDLEERARYVKKSCRISYDSALTAVAEAQGFRDFQHLRDVYASEGLPLEKPAERVQVGRSVMMTTGRSGGYVRVELIDLAGYWVGYKKAFSHSHELQFVEFIAPADATTHELQEAWTTAYAEAPVFVDVPEGVTS